MLGESNLSDMHEVEGVFRTRVVVLRLMKPEPAAIGPGFSNKNSACVAWARFPTSTRSMVASMRLRNSAA
jgi:hypothetical protein